MITQTNIDNLYKIASNLSMNDYLMMNPTKSDNIPRYKKHRPYSLSDETIEATDLYKIACKRTEVTREEEEQIKGYLLKIRIVQPELLEENNSFRQWKNASGY